MQRFKLQPGIMVVHSASIVAELVRGLQTVVDGERPITRPTEADTLTGAPVLKRRALLPNSRNAR
jgi:hypothetical protein